MPRDAHNDSTALILAHTLLLTRTLLPRTQVHSDLMALRVDFHQRNDRQTTESLWEAILKNDQPATM